MIESIPDAFRLLADDLRMRLLFALGECGEATVESLAERLACEAGLVRDELIVLESDEAIDADRRCDPCVYRLGDGLSFAKSATQWSLTLKVRNNQSLTVTLGGRDLQDTGLV